METKLKFNLPKEKSSIIKVIGVGGGGGNAVNHMHEQGIKGVDFIICNTDLQALEASAIQNKIQLGTSLTQGLGAGANPEVGKRAAMEAIEDIIDMLGVNTKMIFITAGMGGGTGTGAAPIIAKTAREMDILTVGIVTTPFVFEGKRRKQFADEGLENLKKSVDCLLIISNDKIKEMYGNLALREAFGYANNILTTAAKGIAEIITQPGYINVDFEDVRTVIKSSGVALMGSAVAEGRDRAIQAVKAALASPLLNDNQIVGAKNILLNISSGTDEILMEEFDQISTYIQNETGLSAELIVGTSFDESLGNKISVTLIATGFESAPKVNKVIIGSTIENEVVAVNTNSNFQTNEIIAQEVVKIVEPAPQNIFQTPNVTTVSSTEIINNEAEITSDIVRLNLFEEEKPKVIENNTDNELGFGLRIDHVKEEFTAPIENSQVELKIDEAFISKTEINTIIEDKVEVSEQINEQIVFEKVNENVAEVNKPIITLQNDFEAKEEPKFTSTKTLSIDDDFEANTADQDKKIERQIQRIKELKNLNITINNPQGLRDLEKEPAYLRRNKKLDEIPHSSEQQVSRLSLFEDPINGKSELKTNNSFLHDNVD